MESGQISPFHHPASGGLHLEHSPLKMKHILAIEERHTRHAARYPSAFRLASGCAQEGEHRF
jgi:hypothetical protein